MKFGIDYFPDAHPDRVSGQQYFADVLDLAEIADDLGYDSVKIVEHYFTSYGGYSPDPCLFLAAASQRARRLRLVTGAVLPVFNHPLKLAGQLTMLDAISGGRLDAGVARAFLPYEFDAFGDLDGGEPRPLRGGDRGARPALDRGERHLRGEVPPVQERDVAPAAHAEAASADLGRGGGHPGVLHLDGPEGLPPHVRALPGRAPRAGREAPPLPPGVPRPRPRGPAARRGDDGAPPLRGADAAGSPRGVPPVHGAVPPELPGLGEVVDGTPVGAVQAVLRARADAERHHLRARARRDARDHRRPRRRGASSSPTSGTRSARSTRRSRSISA